MKTTIIPTLSLAVFTALTSLSLAGDKDCNCSESSHSRAAVITGKKVLSYQVVGMSCVNCEKGLKAKLEKVEGLISIERVDSKAQLVSLTVAPEVCETTVQQVITDAGYLAKVTPNAPQGTYVDITVAEAKALLGQDVPTKVLDVRTLREFNAGHIEGAVLLDYKRTDFAKQLAKLDKATPYILHCKSGGRSAKALEQMKEQGFTTVYHLTAGYDGWSK